MNGQDVNVKSVVIDGQTYEFYHLSIRVLNRILLRALKLIGKSMADNFTTELGKNEAEMIKTIMGLLSEHIDVDTVDAIILDLLSATIAPGKGAVKKSFDAVFEDDIVHMWKVIIEAAKYYFASFFQKGSKILMEVKAAKEAEVAKNQ